MSTSGRAGAKSLGAAQHRHVPTIRIRCQTLSVRCNQRGHSYCVALGAKVLCEQRSLAILPLHRAGGGQGEAHAIPSTMRQAIHDGQNLEAWFTRGFYKHMLGRKARAKKTTVGDSDDERLKDQGVKEFQNFLALQNLGKTKQSTFDKDHVDPCWTI